MKWNTFDISAICCNNKTIGKNFISFFTTIEIDKKNYENVNMKEGKTGNKRKRFIITTVGR